MTYLIFAAIGITMGLFGGLLGIGGSIIMIPALVFFFGENQHLYQGSAMICNFFVGVSALLVHRKAKALTVETIKWLVPASLLGVMIGVAISNSSAFARENSFLLARVYGIFLLYVIASNARRFTPPRGGADGLDISHIKNSVPLTILSGLMTGVPAGLLGIGGGIICIPAQQFFLKMPLKRAIANSAATIAALSFAGAFYKNLSLPQHDIQLAESAKIALPIIPCAFAGAFLGSRLMHKLPANLVRAIFIIIAAVASYRMLTVAPGG